MCIHLHAYIYVKLTTRSPHGGLGLWPAFCVMLWTIEVLTEGCQPPTRLAATDIILYVILTITMTDTFSHFALQLLPTLEAESRWVGLDM